MEEIIKKIEKESKAKINAIKRSAQKEATAITKQAEERASEEKKALVEKGKRAAEQEKERVISRARSEARKQKLAELDALLSDVYKKAQKNLAAVRKNKQYTAALNRLVQEGVDAINAKEIIVQVAPADRKAIKKPHSTAKVHIQASKNIVAGAIISSKDGRAIVNNSLAAVLEQKWPQLKKHALEALIK